MSELLKLLDFPYDLGLLSSKKNRIRRELKADGAKRIHKKIAVLGGSTTHDIISYLELFLLYQGFDPEFYESEYNKFYEDVMFANEELRAFHPDIIFIHTSYRNLINTPCVLDSKEEIMAKLDAEFSRYRAMWEKIACDYGCTVIQNNFELPFYRLLGNKDVADSRGLCNFIIKLNLKFYEYAENQQNFFINDLNYIASNFGLERWHQPSVWYLYKYCCCIDALPLISYSVSNIIKSLYGKNKKGFVLDLDNTLWGGVIGDDGVEHIEIGHETANAEGYTEFQKYLKAHTNFGVILNVNSKNEEENALAGLNHPETVLKKEDFIMIKANWQPKSQNLQEIADTLTLLPESLVFIDDNPAEREIVKQQIRNACVPDISTVENYIREIDRHGYFEVTNLSADDLKRTGMYKANASRIQAQMSFADYDDYLRSLEMTAEIKSFSPVYMQRIAQLTNKSNQFNLTTKRYSLQEIESVAEDGRHICLYGKLVDKFGDNGVVSVVIGKVEEKVLDIELFLMSCRVLKRGMEQAMLDELVKQAISRGISTLKGYYFKTAKNAMVAKLYKSFGFTLKSSDGDNTVWSLDLNGYQNRQSIIKVED